MQHLMETLPKNKLNLLQKSPGGLEQVLQDYLPYLQEKEAEKNRQRSLQQFNQKLKREKTRPLIDQEIDRYNQAYRSEAFNEVVTPKSNMDLVQSIENSEGELNNDYRLDEKIKEDIARPYQLPELKKLKDIVITPLGAGEITHKGKSGVIVNVNNQKKSFKNQDISVPSEEATEFVRNFLEIPEKDRSSNISLFTYDLPRS